MTRISSTMASAFGTCSAAEGLGFGVWDLGFKGLGFKGLGFRG